MRHTYDAILLLGLKLEPDGSPRQELLLRIQKAAECYFNGLAPLIIPCGGQTPGTPVSEAAVMRRELLQLNVPEAAIHCEDRSQITVENFLNAKALLPNHRRARVLIVTSDYHMLRSQLICRISAGMHAGGRKAVIPYELKKTAVRKEPLHLIDYMLGYQSGRFSRPKLYLKLMDFLFARIEKK